MFFAVAGAALVMVGIGLLLVAASQAATAQEQRGLLKHNLREVLERPWRVERFVYRHHRAFGSAIAVGALMLLALLGTYKLPETNAWRVPLGVQLTLISVWVLLVFALVIGIYILVRPSALKGFESLANRWIEPFSTPAKESAAENDKPAGFLCCNFHRAGMLSLLAGLCCLVAAAAAVVV